MKDAPSLSLLPLLKVLPKYLLVCPPLCQSYGVGEGCRKDGRREDPGGLGHRHRVEIIEILTISRQGRRIILKRFDDFFFIRIILSLLRKIQRNLILLERMKRTNFYY